MYYFDNSATTQPSAEIMDVYREVAVNYFANPSSAHYLGEKSRALLEGARSQTADLLDYYPAEIYFTSSGTESNNWALQGGLRALSKVHPERKRVLISSVEHGASLKQIPYLEELGYIVDLIPVDSNGCIDLCAFRDLIEEDVIMVSTMSVNNEVGAIQPIKEMAEILQDWPQLIWHVDGVQGVTTQFEDLKNPRIDMLSLSGHKFHAPRGVGVLAKRQRVAIEPLLYGGGQEMGFRSSTENLAGIVTTARALREAYENQSVTKKQLADYRQQIVDKLNEFNWIVFGGDMTSEHIVCAALEGIPGEVMLHAMEEQDVIISTTSACSSRVQSQHSTLSAMGIDSNISESAVRISMSHTNTQEDVNHLLKAIETVTKKLKK